MSGTISDSMFRALNRIENELDEVKQNTLQTLNIQKGFKDEVEKQKFDFIQNLYDKALEAVGKHGIIGDYKDYHNIIKFLVVDLKFRKDIGDEVDPLLISKLLQFRATLNQQGREFLADIGFDPVIGVRENFVTYHKLFGREMFTE